MDNLNKEIITEKNSKSNLLLSIIIGISVFVIVVYYLLSAPLHPKDIIVHISSNDSLTKISNDLETKKVVKSSFVLKSFVLLFSGDKHISKGDYLFKKNANLLKIAWQLSRSSHGIEPIKVTFKEGITKNEMASLLADKLSSFRKDLFLSDSRSKEGYLFPDTYFFYPMSTNDEILLEMTANFDKKISSISKEIKASGKSLSDIIIMASILEKEANGKSDAPLISGILWRRIELGMPLQVDAAPITYKESGLPKSPISNPGLSSILFAIHPVKSTYLFYLHDKEGNAHFADDFSEHRSNIAKYLK